MRRITAVLMLICLMLCMVSCGNQEHTPVGPEPQTDPGSQTDPGTDSAKEYAKALNDQNTAVDFLEGEWMQCPMGVITEGEPVTSIVFSDDLTASITRDDGEYVLCKYSVSTIMEDLSGSIDELTLIPYEFSKNLFDGQDMSYYLDVPAVFQFLVCRTEKKDLMMIREPGNGESVIGYNVFGYNLLAGDTNAWVFCRDNGLAPLDHEETMSLRKKDSTFYAYSWCCAADYMMLQEVEGIEFTTDWYGDTIDAVLIGYADNDHPLEGVFYDHAAIPGEGDMSLPDILQPMFGIVTTDKDGIITDFEQLDYMGYAVYTVGGVPNSAYPISITEDDGTAAEGYTSVAECRLTDSEECIRMLITANENISDISVVSLTMDEMQDSEPHWITEELYHIYAMSPYYPLSLTTPYLMDLPTYGILIHDQNGQEHLYEIWQSGYDGSLQLNESTNYN